MGIRICHHVDWAVRRFFPVHGSPEGGCALQVLFVVVGAGLIDEGYGAQPGLVARVCR